MWSNPQIPVDLITFIEKNLNGKLHFLCGLNCLVYGSVNLLDLFCEIAGKALGTAKHSIRAICLSLVGRCFEYLSPSYYNY